MKFSLWPCVMCIAMATLFMLTSAAMYWPNPTLAFLSDNSPVSWLSSAQLWATVVLALRLGLDRTLSLWLSLWLALATMMLAFDEQFMLHEHWKFGCQSWFAVCRFNWARELPMIMVELCGSATVLLLYCAITLSISRLCLLGALIIGLLSIVVDLSAWPNFLVRYEEALEVISESLFVGTLLGLRRQS